MTFRFTAIQDISDSALDVTLSVPNAGSTFDLASLIQPGPNGVSQVTAEILARTSTGSPRFLLILLSVHPPMT